LFCFILKDWLLVCREKKEIDLNKWKWQIPLLWFPWLIGVADSFIFVIGFGFYGHNNAWFCGSFLSVESPHRDWRNGELAAIVGVINLLIISMMALLIKVSFRNLCYCLFGICNTSQQICNF